MNVCGNFHSVFCLCLTLPVSPSLPFPFFSFFDSQLWVTGALTSETVDKQGNHSVDIIFSPTLMVNSYLESAALSEAGYMALHTFVFGMKAGRTDVAMSMGDESWRYHLMVVNPWQMI